MKRILLLLVLLFSVSLIFNHYVLAEPNNSAVIDINKVKIEINGQKNNMGSILYEDVTYVPLRAVSDAFGKEISWDAKNNIAKINDSSKQPLTTGTKTNEKQGLGKTAAFLFSTALLISGAILLFQINILRNRKDLYLILKAFSSSSVSNIGLKRLMYSSWVSKIGLGYVACGFMLWLYAAGTSINLTLSIVTNIILIIIFCLLGLWISKVLSRKQYIQGINVPEHSDSTGESGSFSLF